MAVPAVTDVIIIRVRPFQRWLPQILNAVAEIGGVPVERLTGPGQVKRLVTLRQVYALAARDVMQKSYQEISAGLARRDHTSCRLSYLNARRRFAEDAEFRALATVVLDVARVIAARPAGRVEAEPELPL